MAFRTDTPLQTGFEQAISTVAQEKNYLDSWAAQLNGNVTALDALAWMANLNRVIVELTGIAALPGIGAYGQAQYGGTYDLGTNFTSMINALTTVHVWLKTNIPSNSVSLVNGVLTGASFTPAQTAPLRALIVTARSTIA